MAVVCFEHANSLCCHSLLAGSIKRLPLAILHTVHGRLCGSLATQHHDTVPRTVRRDLPRLRWSILVGGIPAVSRRTQMVRVDYKNHDIQRMNAPAPHSNTICDMIEHGRVLLLTSGVNIFRDAHYLDAGSSTALPGSHRHSR